MNCTQQPVRLQLSMMAFFMLQLPLLKFEEALQLHGVTWVFWILFALSPLFVEPLLVTSGL